MKKKCLFLILLIVASIQIANAQDFKSEFSELFKKKDFAGQEKILQDWEKSNPNDPELYVSYFNFYFSKSRRETLTLTGKPGSDDSLALKKENSGETVGYLGSRITFSKNEFDKGISYIDRGIEKFPNRLDMRFGKVYALGQIADYKNFTSEIVKAVEYSAVNKNQWLWKDGKSLDDPQKIFLSSVQSYITQLFDAGDEYAENIKIIAENVLKYYPNSVENLSNLAIYHLLREDFGAALVPLLKAEKLAPTDFIVLSNIAYAFESRGERAKAVKYYELVLKHGDQNARERAQKKLAELNKNK